MPLYNTIIKNINILITERIKLILTVIWEWHWAMGWVGWVDSNYVHSLVPLPFSIFLYFIFFIFFKKNQKIKLVDQEFSERITLYIAIIKKFTSRTWRP